MSVGQRASARTVLGWTIVVMTLVVAIVAPFLLFEDAASTVARRALDPGRSRAMTGLALIVLLGSDIALPVPSSVVSTGAGALLGFVWGTLVSSVGLTLGCLGGYLVGYRYGRPAATAVVGANEIARAEATLLRHGALALLLLRPVPVLAEASVIAAGALRVPFTGVCLSVSVANLALSAWYAAFGAAAAQAGLVLAFMGPLLLPAVALWLHRISARR